MLESEIHDKAKQKAKLFLHDVMGEEIYGKFVTEGKIEIKSGGCIYELTIDGTVVNKTKSQKYCLILAPGIPDRDHIPPFDILAIKYAWLKYRTNTVENVANKTNIHVPHNIEPGRRGAATYSEFVRHMEDSGWRREPLTIQECDSGNLVSTNNIGAGETGPVIQIRTPVGGTITIMGTLQVPRGSESDHKLSVRLADSQDNEIAPETGIEIVKESPTMVCTTIARLPYYHISPIKNNLYTTIRRRKSEYHSFRDGIWLGPDYGLKISVINPDRDIKDIKFWFDMDLWHIQTI